MPKRKTTTRPAKTKRRAAQPDLTSDELRIVAGHEIREAGKDLLQLGQRLEELTLLTSDDAQALVHQANANASRGLILLGCAEMLEDIDA